MGEKWEEDEGKKGSKQRTKTDDPLSENTPLHLLNRHNQMVAIS
jgi:hypothetical protein